MMSACRVIIIWGHNLLKSTSSVRNSIQSQLLVSCCETRVSAHLKRHSCAERRQRDGETGSLDLDVIKRGSRISGYITTYSEIMAAHWEHWKLHTRYCAPDELVQDDLAEMLHDVWEYWEKSALCKKYCTDLAKKKKISVCS